MGMVCFLPGRALIPDTTPSARISACLSDISLWMRAHQLKLNPSKTELLVIPATARNLGGDVTPTAEMKTPHLYTVHDPESTAADEFQKKFKFNLMKTFQCLNGLMLKQENRTLLNEIYTELYITEGDSGDVNKEHELKQIEAASRRNPTEDTPIKCSDIFKPLHEQDKATRRVLTKPLSEQDEEPISNILTKPLSEQDKEPIRN
ncbi:NACHT, LRR and PYD domains-containing protein 12-like, partial [Silurus asotus]